MQLSNKKIYKPIIFTATVTAIAVIARTVLMLTAFDKETLFFNNNLLPTVLYAFVLVSAGVIFVMTKRVTTNTSITSTHFSVLSILCAIVSVGLLISEALSSTPTMAIGVITHWGALVSLAFSVPFYLLSSSPRTNSLPSLPLLNIAPVVYLICRLIDCFTSISIKANSYYLFPNVLSLLALAFYVLYNGKLSTLNSRDKGIPMFAYSLLTAMLLLFSAITDFVVPLKITATDILLAALKIVYVIFAVINIVNTLKNNTEE